MTATSVQTPAPGATYRFVVSSAQEAVETIRARLGEQARVLSVRQVSRGGLAGLFSSPKLEVVAEIPRVEPEARAAAEPESGNHGAALGQRPSRVPANSVGLHELLRRSGFSENFLGRLQASPEWPRDVSAPLHRSIVGVGASLRTAASGGSMPLPARAAFLGTAGVGRSTALCKWLSKEVVSRGRTGCVARVEFDRPNPADGLAVFCEALGQRLEWVFSGPETPSGPQVQLEGADFLLADLPSFSLRGHAENRVLRRFLDAEQLDGRVLVMNALHDPSILRETYAVGRDLGATHLVFTHLDELPQWGRLWDFLVEGDLSPLFLSTGPGLSGDLEEDAVGAVLRRTIPGT
jgi:flagellar biosynthesis protein FlhF